MGLPVSLHFPTAASAFIDAAVFSDLPTHKDGQPVRYKWKESLPLGTYFDTRGAMFTVTAARIDNLMRNFDRARAKGFTPPILDSHEKTGAASRGFIIATRKGKTARWSCCISSSAMMRSWHRLATRQASAPCVT
jgi:hypothetical protein